MTIGDDAGAADRRDRPTGLLVGSTAAVSTVTDPVDADVVTASLLLAQRDTPEPSALTEWMASYVSTLQQLGWTPIGFRNEASPVGPDPGGKRRRVGTPWTGLRAQLAVDLPPGLVDDLDTLVRRLTRLDPREASRWADQTLLDGAAITVLAAVTQSEQTLDLVVVGTWLTYASRRAPTIPGYPMHPVDVQGSTLTVQSSRFELDRADTRRLKADLDPLVEAVRPDVVSLTL